MEFMFIICGVMLLLTAVSQLFWETEYKWLEPVWFVLVTLLEIIIVMIVVLILFVVLVVNSIINKRE